MSNCVTATRICFVCCTESQRQTDFLFLALSHSDKQNLYMFQKRCWKGQKNKLVRPFCIFLDILFLLGTKQIFVTLTQRNKIEYWKNKQFLCGMWQRNWKKPKTNILSDLNFTTAIKLLWGTLIHLISESGTELFVEQPWLHRVC